YWMNDIEACGAAYRERLELAEATRDQKLIADAHYDIGFLSVVANDPRGLLEHEQLALDMYEAIGEDGGAMWARQALGLANFLVGEYAEARDMEMQNHEQFRQKGSPFQVVDSMTFLSGVNFRLGEPATAWHWMLQALDFFAEHDNASGIARTLGMAAILLVNDGDAELGARVAGATYELSRQKGVMVAPVTVLHLTDPRQTAAERLGRDRADALIEDGAMTPLDQIVETVRTAPVPGGSPVPSGG